MNANMKQRASLADFFGTDFKRSICILTLDPLRLGRSLRAGSGEEREDAGDIPTVLCALFNLTTLSSKDVTIILQRRKVSRDKGE